MIEQEVSDNTGSNTKKSFRPIRNLFFKFCFVIGCAFLLVCYFSYLKPEKFQLPSVLFYEKVQIPRVIWMFWDKGWEKAPNLQRACLNSWMEFNPDYKIVAMDMKQAETVINRKNHYTDEAWNTAIIQAKSDIIRIELLALYGGIWADATVRCNDPLASWIDSVIEPTGFFVYERRDSAVPQNARPHISSWFIATTNSSYIISKWRNQVRKMWSTKPYPPEVYGYFWAHRIFRDLTRIDQEFYNQYKNMPLMDAAGPHCFANIKSYMNKMKTSQCKSRYKSFYNYLNIFFIKIFAK
ncbi:uncharacterized protein LOC134691277 [Mytilus trossulus]|uniref:uncharacterized protein LOC134691277 n=1 Tax=Mytilus trossulus TaxID=6551 RepID=UPI003003C2AE